MILNSQRTMYGLNLSMNELIGLDHSDLPNTTLNEKFAILPNQPIEKGVYPKLKYLTIGIGGKQITDSSEFKFNKHRSMDAALFEHVPFIMRPLSSDLVGIEREKYRLRTEEKINGIDYACYYAKVIPSYSNRNAIMEVSTSNGLTSIKEISTNDSTILNPIPRLIEDYMDTEKSQFMVKSIKVEFSLYKSELEEINSAMMIKNGELSNLTEIGIAAGIDKYIDNAYEITNTIMYFFAEVDINSQIFLDNNKDYIRNIEIGGGETILR